MSRQPEPSDRPSGVLSFDQLYELYATDVLRVSYYYLGNREMAEDVTQDVFVKLLLNKPDLEAGKDYLSIMYENLSVLETMVEDRIPAAEEPLQEAEELPAEEEEEPVPSALPAPVSTN